jgi:Sulfotransferase domain
MSPSLERHVIGLGGQRCGSTWLHEQLAAHPGIVTPPDTKEVHFFDRRWAEGPEWYAGLFAGDGQAVSWESTPNYLYEPDVPRKIAGLVPGARFVVLLRDPVTRSTSHYRRLVANTGRSLSFAEAVAERPTILRFSRYAEHLEQYLAMFPRDRLLIAFYEDIAIAPAALLRRITDFIGIEPCSADAAALGNRINEAPRPRHGKLFGAMNAVKRSLHRAGLSSLVAFGRSLGVQKLAGSDATAPRARALSPDDLAVLTTLREDEIVRLRSLGIDASRWFGREQLPSV